MVLSFVLDVCVSYFKRLINITNTHTRGRMCYVCVCVYERNALTKDYNISRHQAYTQHTHYLSPALSLSSSFIHFDSNSDSDSDSHAKPAFMLRDASELMRFKIQFNTFFYDSLRAPPRQAKFIWFVVFVFFFFCCSLLITYINWDQAKRIAIAFLQSERERGCQTHRHEKAISNVNFNAQQ